ncbi:hypothetical protein [Kribbella lupini]|uniref:Tetratricopeptide repeat protein n=1 Tax=Kribbella lupini TaxID=291602 RepID=A0ABP4MRF3_9ACTN
MEAGRSRADAGDPFAAKRLAEDLAQQGRIDDAIHVLRPLADVGNRFEAQVLMKLLAQRGSSRQGERTFRRGRRHAVERTRRRQLLELGVEKPAGPGLREQRTRLSRA